VKATEDERAEERDARGNLCSVWLAREGRRKAGGPVGELDLSKLRDDPDPSSPGHPGRKPGATQPEAFEG
jgi:hypothetical protein